MRTAFIVMAILLAGSVLSCRKALSLNAVDARDLSICVAYVRAVDMDTGHEVHVGVSVSKTGLGPHMKEGGGEKAVPAFIELGKDGLCRITWIGYGPTSDIITLTADGYEPAVIPSDLIHRVSGTELRGGPEQPREIRLKSVPIKE